MINQAFPQVPHDTFAHQIPQGEFSIPSSTAAFATALASQIRTLLSNGFGII